MSEENAGRGPFSTLLRRYRLAAGLSQETLAERAKLSVRAVSDLERGVRRLPYRVTVAQLADALALDEKTRQTLFDAANRTAAPTAGAVVPEPPMADLLLETKLALPPVRPALVARSRLTDQLDHALKGALTLLAAPPGSGKTTLLSAWRALAHHQAFAFVALDAADNEPLRFWRYVCTALERAWSGVGDAALALMRTPQPLPIEVVLTTLINRCSSAGDIILALDDYHVITNPAIHQGMAFLLDHLPAPLHVLLLTRTDPPFPLARLRARGQLTELRAADLRFSATEATAFLQDTMHVALDSDDVAALTARTEGWAAGLQFAALALQGRADPHEFVVAFAQGAAGSQRYIFDYLLDEVVTRQPADVQRFLLHTAVLDRLCGPLCDAVLHKGSATPITEGQGQGLLEYLQAANLFLVPLDDEGTWYRYHHLFADVLRVRLKREQPALVNVLHLHASDWYARAGLVTEAVGHALAANDPERAADIVEPVALRMVLDGQHDSLLAWIERIPGKIVGTRVQLALATAWALFLAHRMSESEQLVQEIEDAVRLAEDHAGLGAVLTLRSHAARQAGNAVEAIRYAREALVLLPMDDVVHRSTAAVALGIGLKLAGNATTARIALVEGRSLSRTAGNILGLIFTTNALAETRAMQGALREAVALFEESLVTAGDRLQFYTLGGHLELGDVLRELNQLDAAERHLRTGIDLAEQTGRLPLLPKGYVALARIREAHGDDTGADTAIATALRIAERSDNRSLMRYVEAYHARLALARGAVHEASCWEQECRARIVADEPSPAFVHEAEQLTLVRILINRGAADEALRLLADLHAAITARGGAVVEVVILQALAHQNVLDRAPAMEALERALLLGVPNGYVRVFLDEGSPLAHLLQNVAPDTRAGLFAQRLLGAYYPRSAEWTAAAPVAAEREAAMSRPSVNLLRIVEPLTTREIEVLQLLADGASNGTIATTLTLSPLTVKRHVSNILGKLGVRSRTEAAARARSLGFI